MHATGDFIHFQVQQYFRIVSSYFAWRILYRVPGSDEVELILCRLEKTSSEIESQLLSLISRAFDSWWFMISLAAFVAKSPLPGEVSASNEERSGLFPTGVAIPGSDLGDKSDREPTSLSNLRKDELYFWEEEAKSKFWMFTSWRVSNTADSSSEELWL